MTAFSITYDYMCPFARIANETIVEMLEDGWDANVTFTPFSLHQNSLSGSSSSVWDADGEGLEGRGVRPLAWSLAVRDEYPEHFLAFHRAVFNARHDDGRDINDDSVLRNLVSGAGADADTIADIVESGVPMKTLHDEHTRNVEEHAVFGVPTFIGGGEAVFVRLMERHNRADVEKVVSMVGWSNLNEFKRTRIPR